MNKLYAITDYQKAVERWKRWFKAAKGERDTGLGPVRQAKGKANRWSGKSRQMPY